MYTDQFLSGTVFSCLLFSNSLTVLVRSVDNRNIMTFDSFCTPLRSCEISINLIFISNSVSITNFLVRCYEQNII